MPLPNENHILTSINPLSNLKPRPLCWERVMYHPRAALSAFTCLVSSRLKISASVPSSMSMFSTFSSLSICIPVRRSRVDISRSVMLLAMRSMSPAVSILPARLILSGIFGKLASTFASRRIRLAGETAPVRP